METSRIFSKFSFSAYAVPKNHNGEEAGVLHAYLQNFLRSSGYCVDYKYTLSGMINEAGIPKRTPKNEGHPCVASVDGRIDCDNYECSRNNFRYSHNRRSPVFSLLQEHF